MIEKAVHGVGVDGLEVIDLEKRIHQHLDVALDVEALLHHEAPVLRLELLEVLP